MKELLLIEFFLLFPAFAVFSQSPDQNYIVRRTMTDEDGKTFDVYTSEYSYDKSGNITEMWRLEDVALEAAGYVAAIKGLTWKQARAGFDGLQKLQDKSIKSTEKMSTQNAQYYGFIRGQRRLIINHSKK